MFRNSVYSRMYKDIGIDQLSRSYYTTNKTWDIQYNPVSFQGPCPSGTAEKIARCSSDLGKLSYSGFPWENFLYYGRNQHTLVYIHTTIGDSHDILDHICRVFQELQDCISDNQIKDSCLLIPLNGYPDALSLKATFYFICNLTPRSRDTVHSLQCLKDTRVLSYRKPLFPRSRYSRESNGSIQEGMVLHDGYPSKFLKT